MHKVINMFFDRHNITKISFLRQVEGFEPSSSKSQFENLTS